MLRKLLILFIFVMTAIAIPADDFVDDVYYLSQVALTKKLSSTDTPLEPYYNKNVREIIFLDTTDVEHPDTVRAIIRDNNY